MGRARGKFLSYDRDALVRDLATIPTPDLGFLFDTMDRYSAGDEAGFTTKSYGDGLLMLKKDRRNGRLLFSHDPQTGPRPVALLTYKKESQDAPAHLIATARERRGRWIEQRRRDQRE